MTELYAGLTIWGGAWTWTFMSTIANTNMANDSDADKRAFIAFLLASTLALAIGICGLIGGAL